MLGGAHHAVADPERPLPPPRVILAAELVTPSGESYLSTTLGEPPDAHFLGKGATGRVYAAQWRPAEAPESSMPVAVKTVRLDNLPLEDVTKFRREAAVQYDVSHPHIAALYGVGEFALGATPALHFVMELGSGGGLDALVKPGGELHHDSATLPLGSPARLARVTHLAAQAALGLLQAHARGFTHCDVKLENLILGSGGRVLVTDFGIAFRVRQGGRPMAPGGTLPGQREQLGTLGYLAPENFQECAHTGQPPCDVYSLAFVLLELAQGAVAPMKLAEFSAFLPPPGSDLAALGIPCEGRNLRPRMPEAVDPRLAALIQACWAADPRARPPMAEVARQLLDVHSQASAALRAEVDAARTAAALAEQAAQQALLAAQERAALAEEAAASARAASEASAARLQQTEAAMTQLRAEHEQCSALQDAAVRQHALPSATLTGGGCSSSATPPAGATSNLSSVSEEPLRLAGMRVGSLNDQLSKEAAAMNDCSSKLATASSVKAEITTAIAFWRRFGGTLEDWERELKRVTSLEPVFNFTREASPIKLGMHAEITVALGFRRRFGGTLEDWERELTRVVEKETFLQIRHKHATANYQEISWDYYANDDW